MTSQDRPKAAPRYKAAPHTTCWTQAPACDVKLRRLVLGPNAHRDAVIRSGTVVRVLRRNRRSDYAFGEAYEPGYVVVDAFLDALGADPPMYYADADELVEIEP